MAHLLKSSSTGMPPCLHRWPTGPIQCVRLHVGDVQCAIVSLLSYGQQGAERESQCWLSREHSPGSQVHSHTCMCMCRSFGLGRHWRRLYCALIPFSPAAGSAATDLRLLLIDEATLCCLDTISVTACKASRASSADKTRINLVSVCNRQSGSKCMCGSAIYLSMLPHATVSALAQASTVLD